MRILVTGIGDAFTRRYYGTSAVIEAPEGHVLIDCPDLVHRALHDAATAAGWPVDAGGIDDIILTHLHGDHCNGLESFGFHRRLLQRTHPELPLPRLHMLKAVADRVWERLAPAMDCPFDEPRPSTLADYFDVRILPPDAEADVAGLKVRCRRTRHPVPTIGLLITNGRTTLGWSGDTAFEAAHIEWLSEADLIVHEVNRGPVHTAIEDLNGIAAEIRRKTRLTHIIDDFDPSCTDMKPLHEGEVLEVG